MIYLGDTLLSGDVLDFYTGIQAQGIAWNGTHHVVAGISRLYMFDRTGRRAPSADVAIPSSVYHSGSSAQRREIRGLTWQSGSNLYWLLAKELQDHQGTNVTTRLVSLTTAGVVGVAATVDDNAQAVIWDGTHLNLILSQGQVRRYNTTPAQVGSSINLPSGPDDLRGGVFADSKFWLADSADDKVYVFTSAWARSATDDFDLVTDTAAGYNDPARDNTNPAGVSWDGRFVRVADNNYFRRKVFTYGLDGAYLGAA